MKKTTFVILAIAALFMFSTVAFAADGGALFKTKCAACHGADGSGATPTGQKLKVRDLRGAEVQALTDAQLFDMIANGGPNKKPTHQFKSKGLSDADVNAIVAFIRTIKK